MKMCILKLLMTCRSAQERASGMLRELEKLQAEDSRLPAAADAVDEELKELEKTYREAYRDAKQLIAYVNRLSYSIPPPQGLMIRLRYVQGHDWRAISKIAKYSESHCYALHRKALQSISEELAEDPPPAPACVRKLLRPRPQRSRRDS